LLSGAPRPSIPHLHTVVDTKNVSGSLFYATCDLAAGCDTLEFASLDLATLAKTDLFDFPLDSYDDAFVADNVLIDGEVTISLNYDSDPDRGYLAVFDIATRKLVSGRNSSSCFALWQSPANPSALLCLNLVAKAFCPPGTDTQCTLLKSIDRASGAETLIAAIQPGMAPFTVEALDPATGMIYACFAPVNGGGDFVLVSLDAATGAVRHTAPFPYTTAFIELEYSPKTEKLYAVVQDSAGAQPLVFAGTVDPATAQGTPLGPKSYFNASFPPATGGFFNQFNTISTLSDEQGVFFSTAFHYENQGPPPSDPVLCVRTRSALSFPLFTSPPPFFSLPPPLPPRCRHLIANSLVDGELVYDAIVPNPFWCAPSPLLRAPREQAPLHPPPIPAFPIPCPSEILWLPSARA